MVARQVSAQELAPSSAAAAYGHHHLQTDDRHHYIHLEELKSNSHSQQPVYYDLQPLSQSCCTTSMYLGSGQMPSSSGLAMELPQADSTRDHLPKKRKASYHEGSDEDTGDDKSVRTDDNRKQNHSEIEKRRRDKMNTYITELSAMVPMCHAMSRKLDKLTVLRMAVQHLKTIRGAIHSYTEGNYKPAFLSDLQLKQLILQAAEGFLFVVGCDRGRILYVSESVSQSLNYSQGDLLGQSWFDILHPKDVAKVKEQLSSPDLNTRERLIDAKTMLPVNTDIPQGVSRLCPGARRSFFCRMKCKMATPIKEEADTTTGCHRRKKQYTSDRKYRVIQCTGYLKSWAPAKIGLEDGGGNTGEISEGEGDACSLSCLVAVGRIHAAPSSHRVPIPSHHQGIVASHHNGHHKTSPNIRPLQFISRHAMDGKFLFVDQRATLVLGFLPQELLGTSMYEYYYHEDICHLADAHKLALQIQEPITTQVYRFRSKDGNYIQIQSEWKSFKNPWTKEVEYLVAKNSKIDTDSVVQVESSGGVRSEGPTQSQNNYDFFTSSTEICSSGTNSPNGDGSMSLKRVHIQVNGGIGGRDISRPISSHIEASNIGRQIADQVLDEQRKSTDSPSSTPSPSHPETNSESQLSRNLLHNRVLSNSLQKGSQKIVCNEDSNNPIRNNVALSSIEGAGEGEEMMEMMSSAVSPQESAPNDGNDEAAMAVIMSLLEADAGLGGPVDFTGLPWPLP